jgi:hypothetical protein
MLIIFCYGFSMLEMESVSYFNFERLCFDNLLSKIWRISPKAAEPSLSAENA